jgi:hypothetical protein
MLAAAGPAAAVATCCLLGSKGCWQAGHQRLILQLLPLLQQH